MISSATRAMWVNRIKAFGAAIQLGKISKKLNIQETISSFARMLFNTVLWILLSPYKFVLMLLHFYKNNLRNSLKLHLALNVIPVFCIIVGILILITNEVFRNVPASVAYIQKASDGEPCVKEKLANKLALNGNRGPLLVGDVKDIKNECDRSRSIYNEIESQKNFLGVK